MDTESTTPQKRSPKRTDALSFCVVSATGDLNALRRVIVCIKSQTVPVREIIVCGDVPAGLDEDVIRLSCIRAAEENRIGELRNRACQRASSEIIVVCDEDITLAPDFCERILENPHLEVVVPRIENPDGTRYWDWATFGGPKGHALLRYTENDPYSYIAGNVYAIHRSIAQRVLWEELRPVGIPQSVDFSRRILTAGYQLHVCPSALATHEDNSYTQTEDYVRRIFLPNHYEDIGDGILGRGVYDQEQDGSRLLSPVADIEIPPELLEKPSLLSFTLQSHASELYQSWPLRCEVAVGGTPTLDLTFESSTDTKEIVLPLAASATKIVISFKCDSCVVPRFSVSHRDTRVFSLFLSHLMLEKKSSLYTTSKLIEGSPQARSTFHSLPIGVLFMGPHLDASYWGAESRSLLENLEKLEIPLGIDSLQSSVPFIRSITSDSGQKEIWHKRFSSQLRDGVFLLYADTASAQSPEYFHRQLRLHPHFARNILRSFTQENLLNSNWQSTLDGYDELWVPSHYQRMLFSEEGSIPQHKIRVMPVGVDTNFYNPDSVKPLPLAFNRGFTFLSDLYINESSGWRELLEAYFSVFDQRDDVSLILRIKEQSTSTTSEADAIRTFIKKRGYDHPSSPPIFFLDASLPHEQIPSLYAVAHAFVLPTASDVPPEDLLRAMSMGLPVITTGHGSANEFINDDVGALIGCRAADTNQSLSPRGLRPASWQHLAQLMREFYENQNRTYEKGINAREIVLKRYRIREVAGWIERTLGSYIGRSPQNTSIVRTSLASQVERTVSEQTDSPLKPLQLPTVLEKRRSTSGKVVAIDSRPLLYPQIASTSKGAYSENHLRALAEIAPEWEFHLLFHSLETTPQIERLIAAPNVKRLHYERACTESYDIFHIMDPFCIFPDCDSPFRIRPQSTVTSAVVHTLSPISLPDSSFHTWDQPTQNAYLSRVDQIRGTFIHLLSPSIFMALETGRQLNIPHERNSIIHTGPESGSTPPTSMTVQERQRVLDRLGLHSPFLLFSGSLDAQDNFGTALLALGKARTLAEVELVVTTSPYDPLVHFYKDLCTRQRIEGVRFIGDLNQHDTSALYSSALATVATSLYLENGSRLVDALANGCPIIGCNAGAIPEVVGEAGLLTDNQDVSTLSEYILRVLRDEALQLSLQEKALARAQGYTWRNTADLTLKAWKDLLAGREIQPASLETGRERYISNYLPSASEKLPNAFLKNS